MPIPSHLPSRQQAIDVMNKSVRKDGKKLCNKDFTQFFSISENCVRDFKNTEKTVHDSTWWHIGESLWRLPTEQKPEGTPITKEEREQYKKVLRERKKELREEKKDDKKDEKKDEKKDDKDEKEKGKDEEKKEDKKDEKKDDKVEDKVEDKKDEKKDDKKDDKDEKEKGKDEEKKEDKKKSKEDEKKEKVQDKVDSMRDDKKDDPKKGYDNVHDISGLMEYNEKRGRREIIRKKQPKKEDPDSEDSSRKSEVKSEKKSGEKEKEEDKEEKKVEKKGKKEDKDEKDKEKTKKEKVKEKTKETKKKLIAKVKCWMFKARWRKAQYGALSVIKLKNKIAYRTQKIKKIQALTRGYLVRKRFQKRLEVFRNVLALLEISREMNEIIGRLNETSQNKWRQPAEATTRDLENLVVKIKHFDSPDRVEEARKSYDNYVKRVDSMIADLRNQLENEELTEVERRRKEDEEKEKRKMEIKALKELLIHREREEERERAQKEYEAQLEVQRLQEAAEKEEEQKRQEKEERDRLDAMVSSRLNTSDGVALVAEKPEPVAAPAAKNKYDLGNLKHADLRDAINTSNDVEMLKACKEEEEARPGQLTVKVSTEAHSKSMPFQREVSPVKKKGPETWPPGDIHTVPTAKIVFNAPYDDKQTYHIKVINSTERRIVYALKTTNLRRFGVDPPCGVLDPKEAVLLAVSCDAFAYGQEDTNNDRISIEWTNTPDGAAKQFSREVFLNGTSKRKKLVN